MSTVSNFVGTISPEMFGDSINKAVQNVDLDDTTFSDMLEKQINNVKNQANFDVTKDLGLPSGINIMDLTESALPQYDTNTRMGDNMLETVKPVNETDEAVFRYMNDTKNMSTPEVVTLFSSLFDKKPTIIDDESNGLIDFEKKIAAGEYNRYAKNIVTDLTEFVTDTMKIKS